MNKRIITALMTVAMGILPLWSQEADSAGKWIGEFKTGERTIALKVSFRMEKSEILGSADALNPLAGIRNAVLSQVAFEGRHAAFVLAYRQQDLTFDGEISGEEMAGSIRAGGAPVGEFRLIRYLTPDPRALQGLAGFYELGRGEYVSIFQMEQPGGMKDLYFYHYPSGRFAPLIAVAANRFVAMSSLVAAFPFDYTCEFAQANTSGEVELDLLQGNEEPRRAPKAAGYSQREVSFPSGELLLRGDLLLPPGAGPHPAIVLIHGSGPGPRVGMAPMARYFVRQGFATLAYDKRGCGASTGDWRKAGFRELALDAIAGVAFLRAQPEIAPRKVGLYGISQGGWVAPLAASLSEEVAFVISHSGPGVTPAEQDSFTMSNSLKAAGLTEAQIARLVASYNMLYDYAATGEGAEKLDAAAEELRADPVLNRMAPPKSTELGDLEKIYARQPVGDPGWYMHLDVRHDPLAVYRKVKCPLYCIFGRYDWMVPVEKSVTGIEQALRESGHKDSTIKIFPDGGHGLMAMSGPGPADIVSPARIVPGLFESIAEWLRRFR